MDQLLVGTARYTEFEASVRACRTRVTYEIIGMGLSEHDAEDVVQTACRKAWLAFAQFNRHASFLTWFCEIARNTAIDKMRRDNRRRHLNNDFDMSYGIEDPNPDPEMALMLTSDELCLIKDALPYIAPQFRQVLELHYFKGLTYREIREALGISSGTLKARMHKGRRALQRRLNLF